MKMEELADITKELRDARRDDRCGWMNWRGIGKMPSQSLPQGRNSKPRRP